MKIRYEKVLLILNYSALVVLCREQAEAVFLNLFMTNPLHVETDVIAESSTGDRRSLDQALGSADGQDGPRLHPKDVRGASLLADRDGNVRRPQPASGQLNDHGGVSFAFFELWNVTDRIFTLQSHSNCNEDRECQLGMYCDRHYGLCKPYRTMGQLCRRDAQCAIGYDCMFGRCLVASKPGHRGEYIRREIESYCRVIILYLTCSCTPVVHASRGNCESE